MIKGKMNVNGKKLGFFGVIFVYFLLLQTILTEVIATPATSDVPNTGQHDDKIKSGCTDLARDDETLIVFSTLGGGLTAIHPITSEIVWTIVDDPPIMTEQQTMHVPQYLPNPRDGSIYQLGNMGSLKKLPFTIPELVANAPCRSSDGILYAGKKSDTWFIVDPKTGRREKIDFQESAYSKSERATNRDRIGWVTSRAVYLGRTQYTVIMYDSLALNRNSKPWNITFYDYNAMATTPDISKDYEYLHLTTTSNGNILTLNRKTGKFLWRNDLNTPVVAVFLLGPEGLLTVPFTTVSSEAFKAIEQESKDGNVNTVKLFESLYVGEHRHGLYAIPSLVDKSTPRITASPAIKLLDGPHAYCEDDTNTLSVNDVLNINTGVLLGHYNVPNDVQFPLESNQDASKKHCKKDLLAIKDLNIPPSDSQQKQFVDAGIQTESDIHVISDNSTIATSMKNNNIYNKTKKYLLVNSYKLQRLISELFMEHPSSFIHQILFLVILLMVCMFWYTFTISRELKQQSENSSKTLGSSGSITDPDYYKGNSSDMINIKTENRVYLSNGSIQIGKISFNLNDVLGKGCEGTFVFRGLFEERNVAVKRLLPECFTFADREVALLRESDAHENVVRYFCTEHDRQFRYIAVELCAATLQDYTIGERSAELHNQINIWEVLRQSAAGLSHLHSLNIVHRDIKPQNVLLSLPDANGCVRVMISDFGLCKKLKYGKTSFSTRSGVTGTDGWIAPEMMLSQRTTTAVDIFSLGCVYYYVLSDGQHLFGDFLKRQANILTNEYKIELLTATRKEEQSKIILIEQLITDMIQQNPQRRPPAVSVINHPVFWNNQRILMFLQDVSDRVEKLQFDVEPLKSLERNGKIVVLNDWNLLLDPLLSEDLRKFRGYRGESVRDLLRALRNKKHHYHELNEEMRQILGTIPNEFTNYWLSRFPQLLSHAFHALNFCCKEPIFSAYYSKMYQFTKPDYFTCNDVEEYDPLYLMSNEKVMRKSNVFNINSNLKKSQYVKQRKGAYNFRKTNANNINREEHGRVYAGGWQRNRIAIADNSNDQKFNCNQSPKAKINYFSKNSLIPEQPYPPSENEVKPNFGNTTRTTTSKAF